MIWNWIITSKLGRAIGGAVAAIGIILGYGAIERRKGRKQGAEGVRRRAEAAAEARKDKRDEIDDDISNAGGAADRLRDEWGRD